MLLVIAFALAGCESVPEPVAAPVRDCVRPEGVANISFSRTKYPNIRRHFRRAVRDGWPRVLVLRRRVRVATDEQHIRQSACHGRGYTKTGGSDRDKSRPGPRQPAAQCGD